ncbi:MAG: dipeptidase [Acidimicrobiales bacterium]
MADRPPDLIPDPAPAPSGLALSGYVQAEAGAVVERLLGWLRIPSISAHPGRAGDLADSAAYGAGLLRSAGLDHVEVLPTGEPPGRGGPAVYGDWLHAGSGAPTVLVYGHHDVQPVDPLEEWLSPPFEPVVAAGECRARGSIDDKGQTLYQIEAARGLLERRGRLPVNLKFLIEGEEEVGSPHLEALLGTERDRLACDVVVVSDTGMISPEVPSTTVSLRGLVAFDVALRSAPADLHSGQWGGTVPNAALIAARLAASLHDAQGRVAIPGFYDRVRPLSAAEAASLDRQPFDEAAFRAQAGVAYLEGEAGRSPLERIGTRPTAEVVGIRGGYDGPGVKTIVPATAGLKVAMRLVPDQAPADVSEAFRAWLAGAVPPGTEVTVTPLGAVAPAATPLDHPATHALTRVIERVWGRAPLLTREGGSGPEEALGRILGAPVLFLGVALPQDRFHAPNERMVMSQFWKGLLAAGELLDELAAAGRPVG